jgi:hypothetical protein
MTWQIHTFGIRHLSPMGAWQLREFLDRTRPDLVLVEGLDDATGLLPDVTRKEAEPPLAILAYTDSQPVRTLVYPFARYSPEYQAIRWAHTHDVPVEFFDLPSDVFLGLQDREVERWEKARHEAREASPSREEPPPPAGVPEPRPRLFQQIADLAGERDYDTYWERHFEHNPEPGSYHGATMELGRVVRELEEDEPLWRAENLVREAYMRRRVEAAIASGHRPDRIVAVVGAYHGPALSGEFPAMTDRELAALPRRASKLTVMPYSYFRLSSQSGYGAGNHAPAYFELLWQALNEHSVGDLSRRYLALVARHLRDAGTHRSTAEVIDAVRLAETLSALKDGLAPTLADLRDSAVALLGQGEPITVREALALVDVGTAIGRLPKGVSQTSIQADFDRELERLKLEKYRTAVQQELELERVMNSTRTAERPCGASAS